MIYIIVAIVTFDYILERWLDYLNSKTWSNKLPDALSGLYDDEKYNKAQQYDKANNRIELLSSTLSFVVTLIILATGFLGKLNDYVLNVTNQPVASCLLFFAIIAVAGDLLSLPFSLFHTFVVEEKFGFNKMTLKTFFLDKLKGYTLGAVIGGCLATMFIWFYQYAGSFFWLYAWAVFAVFSLLMTMFYSSLILPLFNKLTPLPEGELRSAIENYCNKVSFKLDNLFVMDGSKRSSKANAFFSGIGRKKRIVLFDTLIAQHSTDELVAVLAHEIGHYKKKHTQQFFLLSLVQMFITLFIFSVFVNNPSISQALGSSQHTLQLGMIGFGILYSPVSMIIGLMMNMLSRKNEYEADEFAKTTFDSKPLGEALKKLSTLQLSNLQPHPLYVFFHYSHPTLLQRLSAMKEA